MTKSPITTHVLDLHTGKPASKLTVELFSPEATEIFSHADTDIDGRISNWKDPVELVQGVWRLRFKIDDWFNENKRSIFFSDIELSFKVEDTLQHYHIPLLLNQFGFSSYRGS